MKTKMTIIITTSELVDYYKKQHLHNKYGARDIEYDIIVSDEITQDETEKQRDYE